MNYNTGIKYNTGIRYNSPRPPIEAEGIIVRGANGRIVAILTPKDGLKDAEINNTLNGECTLSFSLPIDLRNVDKYGDISLTMPGLFPKIETGPLDQDKRKYIDENCTICAGGKEFVILTPDAKEIVREGKSKWERITAHESWVLLGKKYTTISNDPENTDPTPLVVEILSGGVPYPGCTAGSAKSALSYLLMGTGWSVGIVDVEGIHDLETEKESVLANINKIQQTWGGYLIWDSKNRKVNLRDEEKWQVYTGYQIRYAKNLKGITRTDDYSIVTRLYPFGEDDLDIRTVNNDKLYIENFTYTDRVLEGIWVNQEIDDPQELKDAATKELAKLCKPRHNYTIDHIDLRNVDKGSFISLTMPGVFPTVETGPYMHETFTIGNMVDIVDEELGINTRARVISHRYNLIHDWLCEVEIGDPLEDLKTTIANTVESSEFVNSALRPNTSISNLLKGFVNTFSTKINSANGRLLWDDGVFEAVEVDANGDLTGRRVRLTPGGIGISNDYGKTYVTAMTGDGILANTIICSMLYALSSEDGFTQMVGDGLRVHDEQGRLRAHLGQYLAGLFGLALYNIYGDRVFEADDKGDLEMTGKFITYNGGQKALEIARRNVNLYDWEGTERAEPVGQLYSSRRDYDPAKPGVVLANKKNAILSLSYEEGDTFYAYVVFDKDNTTGQEEPIQFYKNIYVGDGYRLRLANTYLIGNVAKGVNIQDTGGTTLADFIFNHSSGWDIGFYRNTICTKNARVNGNFNVVGAKNALHQTEHYGERQISAYETAEYYFGDIGSGTINQDGECIVYIDDIFSECINTDIEYHVFTQTYNGQIASIDRQPSFFVVYGEPETEFSWELKAKRRGYEYHRLEVPNNEQSVDVANFDDCVCDNEVVVDMLEKEITYNLTDYLLS